MGAGVLGGGCMQRDGCDVGRILAKTKSGALGETTDQRLKRWPLRRDRWQRIPPLHVTDPWLRKQTLGPPRPNKEPEFVLRSSVCVGGRIVDGFRGLHD